MPKIRFWRAFAFASLALIGGVTLAAPVAVSAGWELRENIAERIIGYSVWGAVILLAVTTPLLLVLAYLARNRVMLSRVAYGTSGVLATYLPIFILSLPAAAVHDRIGDSIAALLWPFYFASEWLPVVVAGAVLGSLLFEPQVPAQVPTLVNPTED